MTDEEIKIRLLKEQLQTEQIQWTHARNFLIRHHPEVFVDLNNHIVTKRQQRSARILKRFDSL